MKKIIFIACVLPSLSACGITTQDRALSGAGIGAGIGAVGGAIAGGDPITGAAIGAAAGAAVGAVVKDSQIDLGKPIWK
jgi:hypothetical protein